MKFVLDTSTLSDLMGGDSKTVQRLTEVRRSDVCLPQPVIAEVAYGLARLGKTKRARVLRERFELFGKELPRISWTDEVSEEFGRLKALLEKKGRPNEDFDLAIAAHARVAGAALATRNVRHYERVPRLTVEDWSR